MFLSSELRKQARLLENDIDVKLVAFSKLGATPSTSGFSLESVPLINSEDMFDTLSMELQQLLNKVLLLIFTLFKNIYLLNIIILVK